MYAVGSLGSSKPPMVWSLSVLSAKTNGRANEQGLLCVWIWNRAVTSEEHHVVGALLTLSYRATTGCRVEQTINL